MGEGKLAEFPARTVLEALFSREPAALLSVDTGAAHYEVVVGQGGIRHAGRGQLAGPVALFLLLLESEGTFTLGPVVSQVPADCVFTSIAEVDRAFAAWKQQVRDVDLRFLDPGVLYWWRSRLSKDVQQLPAQEYEVALLTRDRAQTVDALASVLGMDVVDVARLLQRMRGREPFEAIPFVRMPRPLTYRCVAASRDAVAANRFWQEVCGGEMPLQWDSRELLYRRVVSRPGYDLSVSFVMQVLDDTMKDMVERADILFFLVSDLPSDEEEYVAQLRALNPGVSTFFLGPMRRQWTRQVPQSVWLGTRLEREAVLAALDAFL